MIRVLLVTALLALPTPAAAFCKLALALALDISSSVDDREYRLQLDGLANAIESPAVIEAILAPEGAYIEAAAYEWSGYPQQDVVINWSKLDSPAAIKRFSRRLRAHRRPYWDFATAIGKGLEFGAKLLQTAPQCGRRVIDVSGDGVNNIGIDPNYFYKRGLFDGITVNGLVIRGADPDPLPYYQTDVIFGPEAFVAVAEDFEDYRDVIEAKLIREIAVEMVLGAK